MPAAANKVKYISQRRTRKLLLHKSEIDFIEGKASQKGLTTVPLNVYTKDGQTFISGMRPIVLPQFFPQADLGERPKEIDQIIQNIINNAK